MPNSETQARRLQFLPHRERIATTADTLTVVTALGKVRHHGMLISSEQQETKKKMKKELCVVAITIQATANLIQGHTCASSITAPSAVLMHFTSFNMKH